jgi:hypothetical protein
MLKRRRVFVARRRSIQADDQAALEDTSAARQRAAPLSAVLRTIAFTTPRDGQWKQSWRALQRQARELLRSHGDAD